MFLLQSWKESVLLIKPENLKFLLLVTLRTIKQSYKFFISMVLLFMFFDVFSLHIPLYHFIQKILFATLWFLFVLVARPSVKRKTVSYFLGYSGYFMIWFVFSLIIILFGKFVLIGSLMPKLVFVIFPIGVLMILFWLDSRLSCKNFLLSLLRAMKMFVFNFPFYLFSFIVPFFVLSGTKVFIPCFIFKYLEGFIFIFYICFFTNFYIKRLHDQFKIYFT